jgi:hypothetical protein
VSVADSAGAPVAAGTGTSAAVDWTWDARLAARGRYAYSIGAGPTVRPAVGTLGAGAAPPLAIKELKVVPNRISPNGDGQDDAATVSYRLTAPATVTAALADAQGTTLTTLFSEPKPTGKQSFVFAPEGIPNGRYRIVLTASGARGPTVTAVAGIVVDSTLSAPTATTRAFSPNGDGRLDEIGFSFRLGEAAHVQLDILAGTTLVTTLVAADLVPGPQAVTWNGEAASGRVADGSYRALVTARTPVATTEASLPFRVDTVAPTLRALSYARLTFRVSEAAQVTAVVNGRKLVRDVKAGVFALPVRGATRTVSLVVRDEAGNVSRTLRFPR